MSVQFSLNNLRWEDCREGIVEYLKQENEYNASFDFEGSNLGYIIDVAAYVAMMLSYQNTLESNEIFLDTTSIRKNAVSIAKNMGYRPKRKVSSKFTGTIEYIGDADTGQTFSSGDTITIPAKTLFTSSPNGYTYQNTQPIILTYQNEVLLSGNFTAYEGIFKTIEVLGTGKKNQTVVINDEDVENNNMSVSVRNSSEDSSENVLWTQTQSFFTELVDTIYSVEENVAKENTPKIIFGDDVIGRIPKSTETIEIEYLQTKGDLRNGETGLSFQGTPSVSTAGNFGGLLTYSFSNMSIVIPSGQVSYSGASNESLSDIQFNAPKFYSSGNKGVTALEIKTILNNDFSSSLAYSNVVGGNVLSPGVDTELGKTYITAVPTGITESSWLTNEKIYLFESEENNILPQLRKKTVVSTERIFLKPSYIMIDISPEIEVSDKLTSIEIATITSNVRTSLETLYASEKGLGKKFRITNYLNAVVNSSGVISAGLDYAFNFLITKDSFYETRVTSSYLPVLYSKNSAGAILYDNNQNPITTNFIKKRSEIISEENEKRLNTTAYTQFTLPISQSSIYGSLTHDNSNRYIYNIDVSEVEFFKFELITASTPILKWETTKFKDEAGNIYVPNLYELSSNNWQLQLNGRNVGVLTRNPTYNTFQVTSIETTYLTSLGFSTDPNVTTNVTTIETVADVSDSLDGTYFILYSEGDTTTYYVWYNISGSTPDPAISVLNTDLYGNSYTGIEVSGVNTNDTAITVASVTATAIDAITDFTAVVDSVTTNMIRVTNVSSTTSTTSETSDGLVSPTGFTFITTSDDVIIVNSITETDEQDDVTSFFTLSTFLSNTKFSDIRISGITPLATASFNPTTFTWSFTNTPTFKNRVGDDVTFTAEGTGTEVEGLLVNDSSSIKILTLENSRGTFSLTNQNNDSLVPYDQRNDFLFEANYTISQGTGNVTYEYSQITAPDVLNVQTMTMNEPASHRVTCSATIETDIIGDWDQLAGSGTYNTTTGTTANKLVDATHTEGSNFTTDGIAVGDTVYNITDNTYALVTAIDDANTLSLSADIMTSGEYYTIKRNPLNRTYFLLYGKNSSFVEKDYYVWYDVVGRSEETYLPIVSTSIGAYLGKYFIIRDGWTTGDSKYVWFKNNGTGTDPAVSGLTGIAVDLLTSYGGSEELISKAIGTAINAEDNWTACGELISGTDWRVKITNSSHGAVVGVEHGTTSNSEFTISVNISGSDGIDDPTPSGFLVDSGTATTDTTNKLIDTGASWLTGNPVAIGDVVVNTSTTPYTYGKVTAVDSATSLSLDRDTFPGGSENYSIYSGSIRVDLASGDTATNVATKTATAIDRVANFSGSSDTTITTIDGVYNGKVTFISDSTSGSTPDTQTGFTFATTISGARNTTANLDLIADGDIIRIAQNNGSTVSSNNIGYFIILDNDSELGTIKLYNIDGVSDNGGVSGTNDITGVVTHYTTTSGTYGEYIISTYDIFHDSSIGTLKYDTGEIVWKRTIKGYTDFANKETYLRGINTIFDNYDLAVNKVDKIKIVPKNNLSNSGVNLGPIGNFDPSFSIFTIANISDAVLKE